jgi:16S rRNA (guanine527-N7)-methyltransferase
VSDPLIDVLAAQQRQGHLGTTSVEDAIAHSVWVVDLAPAGGLVIDVGSGGGLPGLVIAVQRPDLRVVLIDVRQRRTDALHRAVGRLGLVGRVEIVTDDVARVVTGRYRHAGDLVTARAFGPLSVSLFWTGQLVRSGGRVAVSLPPSPSIPAHRTEDDLEFEGVVGPWGVWRRNASLPRDERST